MKYGKFANYPSEAPKAKNQTTPGPTHTKTNRILSHNKHSKTKLYI